MKWFMNITNMQPCIKVKQSHNTPWRNRGERRHSSYWFMTSALDLGGGGCHQSCPGHTFYPWEKEPPSTQWTGGWVGPRAGVETEARGKILLPLPGIKPQGPDQQVHSQTLYWLSYPGSYSHALLIYDFMNAYLFLHMNSSVLTYFVDALCRGIPSHDKLVQEKCWHATMQHRHNIPSMEWMLDFISHANSPLLRFYTILC
jgi:hypothetical protein